MNNLSEYEQLENNEPSQVQDNKNIVYLGAGVMAGLLLAMMFKKV